MQIANFIPVRLAFVANNSRFTDTEEVDPKLVDAVREVNRLAAEKTRAVESAARHYEIDALVTSVMKAGTLNMLVVANDVIAKLKAM